MNQKNNSPALIWSILSTVIVAVCGVVGTTYSSIHNGDIQQDVVQKQTETQLLLNAYSLADSTDQNKRLHNYIELDLFSPHTRTILEKKLDNGSLLSKSSNNGSSRTIATYVVGVGALVIDPTSKGGFFISTLYKGENGHMRAEGKIIRPNETERSKSWDQNLPNAWLYENYSYNLLPIPGDSLHCLFQVQKMY